MVQGVVILTMLGMQEGPAIRSSFSGDHSGDSHRLLTVAEAAGLLRIGRSLAYQLAHEYLNSGGIAGLPVMRFGTCMRVPSWTLNELITTGRVVRLSDETTGSAPTGTSASSVTGREHAGSTHARRA